MSSGIDFSRSLIKGRIAEVIFEQMLRAEKEFTIIQFGYEHTIPTLAQYQHLAKVKEVIDNVRNAPDFILISNDKERVFLVEVKYRADINTEEIKKTAIDLLKKWDHSWLFVATPKCFFFSPCHQIVNEGKIETLGETWVVKSLQADYLKLLNEFEK